MQNLKYFPRIFCMANRSTLSLQQSAIFAHCRLQDFSRKLSLPNCPVSCTTVRFASSSSIEEKLKKSDNIPDHFRIIYRAPLYSYILCAHGLNTAGILAIAGTLTAKLFVPSDFSFMLSLEFAFWSCSFLLFLGAVSRILYIYILRIYTDEKGSYIMVKSGLIPLVFSKLEFSQGEIYHLEPKGIMPWKFNRYFVQNQSTIILEHYFRKPVDFHLMLSKPEKLAKM